MGTGRRASARCPYVSSPCSRRSFLAVAAPAFADNEGGSTDPARTDCAQCHYGGPPARQGPARTATTIVQYTKCAVCHDVHRTPALSTAPPQHPGRLVQRLSRRHGGAGRVRCARVAGRECRRLPQRSTRRTSSPVATRRRAGRPPVTFGGQNAFLSCDDCHNPHDADTVNPFRGERFRGGQRRRVPGILDYPDAGSTTKLLRRRPSGATTSVAEYGSDWCAACHAGRKSGGTVHNHPVDSKATTTTPFDYNHVALVASDNLTMTTVIAPMSQLYGGASDPTNRGYLMPWPRTSQQGAHQPICQQCHEDSRNAGSLSSLRRGPGDAHRHGDGVRRTVPGDRQSAVPELPARDGERAHARRDGGRPLHELSPRVAAAVAPAPASGAFLPV